MSLTEVAVLILVLAVAIATFAGHARIPWLRSVVRFFSGTGLSLPHGRFLGYGVIAGILYAGVGTVWFIVAPERKLGGLAFLALGAWRAYRGLRESRWYPERSANGHVTDGKQMQALMTDRNDPIRSGQQIQSDEHPKHPVAIALSEALGEEELRVGDVLVETTDGRVLGGDSIIWGWEPDALIVDQDSNDAPTLVPFGQLRAISAKGLNPIRVALIAAVLVSAGTLAGSYLAAKSTQMEPRDGRFLGFLTGAFLSPLVVWLLQGTPWLTRYRVLYRRLTPDYPV